MESMKDNAPDYEFLQRVANLDHLEELIPESEQAEASPSILSAGSVDDVQRLTNGLKDIHDRLTGKRGNPKWVVGHIENLLAGRKHFDWE